MRNSRPAARLARIALPVFATAAFALVLAPPAAQAHTPTAPPTTVARHAHAAAAASTAPAKPDPVLPIDLNLGIVHLKVVVPLTLGGLLGGLKASTPVTTPSPPGPSGPAVPSTGPRASDATPPPATHAAPSHERKPAHRSTAATSAPAQTGGPVQAGGPRPADTTPRPLRTSAAAKAIHHPQAAPNLLQRAFEPSTPVLILAAIAVVCGLGVTSVVVLGGRRGRRAR